MSSLEAVEQFVGAHRRCGSLTPSTSSAGPGGYLLTLSCSCGKTFERWITPEEAESGPGAIPSSPPPAKLAPPPVEIPRPEPHAIDITTAASGAESLEDVMKLALDALETPKAPPSPPRPTTPTPPPTPGDRRGDPPRLEPAHGPAGESLEDVMKLALEAVETPKPPPPPPAPTPVEPRVATPPPAPAEPRVAPPPPAAPRPAAPVAPPPPPRRARRDDAPKPDRSLEDALRATLQALDSGADLTTESEPSAASTAPAPGRGRPLPPGQAAEPGADARRGGRPAPDKQSLQEALRATLSALEVEPRAAAPGSRPPSATPLRADPPARRRKKLSVTGALVIVALMATAVGAGYGLHALGQPPAPPTAAPRPAPRVRLAENERVAVGQVVAALRDVQGVSRTDVSYRVYFNRVAFAKGDVERYLQTVKEVDLRVALNNALALHVLAANVWRAKTLNERDKWEAVGEDPSVELCPGAKRILAIGDEPANMSRAQWRGMALAAGIPLLWDCAAERLAEVERGFSK